MTSVYQKIHALALKAQARHSLQLKGHLHQTKTANISEEPIVVPQTNSQHDVGKNLSYASDLSDATNPIDKAISSLRYSSIPHFTFESQSKHGQQSRKYVRRSEDGWFEDLEENIWKGPSVASSKTIVGSGHIDSFQILETDSDTDSSSSAPSTDSDNEAENWLRMVENTAGECHWEEGIGEKLYRSHGNEVSNLTKGTQVPQNISLKGMARLRRISPRALKTVRLQNTKHDPRRPNVIQGDLTETLKEAKATIGNSIKAPLPLAALNTIPIDQGRHRKTNRLIVTKS